MSLWALFNLVIAAAVTILCCSRYGYSVTLGLKANILASASSTWPRPGLGPGLGLDNLASKMCYIRCKIISEVSISWLYHCNIRCKDSNVDKSSVMSCWHCRHGFLFRNISMWPASTLASKTWPRPRCFGLVWHHCCYYTVRVLRQDVVHRPQHCRLRPVHSPITISDRVLDANFGQQTPPKILKSDRDPNHQKIWSFAVFHTFHSSKNVITIRRLILLTNKRTKAKT